ncbi:MAG: ACP S-malonyltransferase [Acidobacteriota bacterium]
MSKIAYIFPGQGSQVVGMGKDLFDNHQAAREAFNEADLAIGFSLSEMCFSGNDEDLQLTANTQPAILAASIAAYRAMKAAGAPPPAFVAGHSLGEYSALVATGAIKLSDAVKLVRKRGTYMQEAVPIGTGAMAAILGSDIETIERACVEAADGQVCSLANINSPSQVVIAGNTEAIDRACELLKAKGAKRAIKLNVSAPFHCDLMKPAAERLINDLESTDLGGFSVPVVTNVEAGPNDSPERVADLLIRQVWSPVLWLQSVRKMIDLGVDTFIEVGPGKVLTGLIRQIEPNVRYAAVGDSESLRATLETL